MFTRVDISSAGRAAGLALLLALSATALHSTAWAGDTFYTNTDNEDNAGSGVADNDMDRLLGNSDPAHPIEFNIAVSSLPTTSAILTLRAYDVDEEQGEQDDVYLNGVFLGSLSGANNIWNATTFTIDLAAHPNLLVLGNNRVTVQVDTSGDATAWVTNVDWAQLLVDGGAADRGNTGQVAITGYSIAGNTVTIDTQATVNSITGGQYQLGDQHHRPERRRRLGADTDLHCEPERNGDPHCFAHICARQRQRHVHSAGAAVLHRRWLPGAAGHRDHTVRAHRQRWSDRRR